MDVFKTTNQPDFLVNNDLPFDFPTIEFPTTTIVDQSVKNQNQSNDLTIKSSKKIAITNKSIQKYKILDNIYFKYILYLFYLTKFK